MVHLYSIFLNFVFSVISGKQFTVLLLLPKRLFAFYCCATNKPNCPCYNSCFKPGGLIYFISCYLETKSYFGLSTKQRN